MLSYSLARERILNNNSMSSFEQDSLFGFDLDLLYLDKSIELETNLTSMKSNYPEILKPMMDLLNVMDSESFCSKIVKDNKTKLNETELVTDIRIPPALLNTVPYDNLIPLIQLQVATEAGNLKKVQSIKAQGFDMNSVNYDRNSALHIASYLGHLELVSYLLSIGVRVNPENRWGSTPLNYGQKYPEIGKILLQAGGYLARELPVVQKLANTYMAISNL
jgi:hypothetical protein